jgi:hypothetical protein
MSVVQKPSSAFSEMDTIELEMEPALEVGDDLVDEWLLSTDPITGQDSTVYDRWPPAVATAVFLGKVLWASPWSLWGLSVGILGLATGGGMQRSGRILEFWGGILPLFLKHFPFIAGSPVATFGHVVLGRCPRHLDACRPHQLIHVKQYEQWGPLFVPTYITCWVVLWCVGKRPYYDNPFEREAFDKTS